MKDCPFDLLMDELNSNIDERFYIFKKLLLYILNAVSPLRKIRIKQNNLPWVDHEMHDLFSKRDKLY